MSVEKICLNLRKVNVVSDIGPTVSYGVVNMSNVFDYSPWLDGSTS